MPLYEYFCATCQKSFEILCKADNKPSSPVCINCNSFRTKGRWGSFAMRGTASPLPGATSSCGSCSKSNCSTCR